MTDGQRILKGSSGNRSAYEELSVAFAVAGVAAMPLVAQQHPDPDRKVAGGGTLPSGWKGRVDGTATLAGVKMMPMGGGVHFMTGPAGIYYKPMDKASGTYEARATFTQMAAGGASRGVRAHHRRRRPRRRRPEVHLLPDPAGRQVP